MWQSTFKLSDAGVNVLFAFIASFLLLVAVNVDSEKLQDFCETLPRNASIARKIIGQDKEAFQRWNTGEWADCFKAMYICTVP